MAKKRKKTGKNTTKRKVQASEQKPFVFPEVKAEPEEDNDPVENDGLTRRQKLFVEAITGPAIGCATKAAELAGYASENRNSLRVTACRLLMKANLAEAIAHAWAKKKYNPEWTRNRVVEIASVSMNNFESVGEDGKIFTDFEKAAAMGAIGQIREIEETIIDDGEGDGPRVIKRKFKLHNPDPAIALLARMQGLVNDAPAERANDLPLEEHPQAGRTEAPRGAAATNAVQGTIQDRAGGSPEREDGVGETPVDKGVV